MTERQKKLKEYASNPDKYMFEGYKVGCNAGGLNVIEAGKGVIDFFQSRAIHTAIKKKIITSAQVQESKKL